MWISPLVAVQVELFGATGCLERRVGKEPIQPRSELGMRRQLKSAIMFQDIARAEQPFLTIYDYHHHHHHHHGGKNEYRKVKITKYIRTWSHHHIRPVQFPILMPQTRPGSSGPRFVQRSRSGSGVLAPGALEERHELFERSGKLVRAGRLTLWLLRLQKAVECGDERARYMVCL